MTLDNWGRHFQLSTD